MPDRLLRWRRTPSRPRDDYTGTDPARPGLYARVYLSTGAVSARPWYWVLAGGTIASGYEATVEDAVMRPSAHTLVGSSTTDSHRMNRDAQQEADHISFGR